MFEAAEFSAVASPSTLPDGSVVHPPEPPVVASTAVGENDPLSFAGFECTVAVRP